MKGIIQSLLFFLLVTVFLSGCGQEQESFIYHGILFEGFDPAKHQPSFAFRKYVEPTKVLLSRQEIQTLKKCVDYLTEHDLLYLLEYADRFVIVKAPYSFADKPQMIVYLDQGKLTMDFSIGDDWENKLLNSNLGLMESSTQFYFKGSPKLPNLLRIILHEIGHLIEYEQLKFNWTGKFIANTLNADFVKISWDKNRYWQDKEGFSEKLQSIQSLEGLVHFLQWFKAESSFFSFSSSMGMNEDFAEAFVYYFLQEYFGYEISFHFQGRVLIDNLQSLNADRQQKLEFIAELIPNWFRIAPN
jgi:hypothetical protein